LFLKNTNANPITSYWAQRYRIFSKYDDGVWLTDDAWFGVTPEPVAKFVTLRYYFRLPANFQ
jgi:hypothetical protein